MKLSRYYTLILFFCASFIGPVYGDGASLTGFASIVTGKVNTRSASVGLYSESWSLRTDTRFGANLLVPVTDYLSVIGQIVAEGFSYGDQDHYEPDIDLLFFRYQLTPGVSLRRPAKNAFFHDL